MAAEEAEGVKSSLRAMVKQLRGELSEKLGEVAEICARGGTINGRTIESARAVLERCSSLNILGDGQLSEQISAVERMLESVNRSRESSRDEREDFVAGLQDVKANLQADVEGAVKDAEASLVSTGRRQLSLA
jgi:hypothetical protein